MSRRVTSSGRRWRPTLPAVAVSQGDMGASRTRRSRTVVPAKAAGVRSPAKAVQAVAAKRVSVSAKTAERGAVSQPRDRLRPGRWDRDWWGSVGEKLITVGQQMGNTTVKTNQRQSTMTRNENPVNQGFSTVNNDVQSLWDGTLKAVARVRIPSGLQLKDQVRGPVLRRSRYRLAILTTF
jgi:hypothetical protein